MARRMRKSTFDSSRSLILTLLIIIVAVIGGMFYPSPTHDVEKPKIEQTYPIKHLSDIWKYGVQVYSDPAFDITFEYPKIMPIDPPSVGTEAASIAFKPADIYPEEELKSSKTLPVYDLYFWISLIAFQSHGRDIKQFITDEFPLTAINGIDKEYEQILPNITPTMIGGKMGYTFQHGSEGMGEYYIVEHKGRYYMFMTMSGDETPGMVTDEQHAFLQRIITTLKLL